MCYILVVRGQNECQKAKVTGWHSGEGLTKIKKDKMRIKYRQKWQKSITFAPHYQINKYRVYAKL